MANIVGGTVVWNLDVNSSKFDAGVKKASNSADGLSKTLKSTGESIGSSSALNFGAFAKTVASAMLTAGVAVAQFAIKVSKYIGVAGIAATTFAVKGAADMQMLRRSLDTLTGSAEEGSKIFQQLNKYAAKTPYQTKELAQAAKTMMAFGINAGDTMNALKMLGDVALGDRERLSGLSLAFSQVQSTGRLMGQDLLQMINQGFNPLQIISEKTGKSMAVLKKEMENGAISADMVTEAFKIATSEGGRFYNGAAQGSTTLGGVFSTLTENVQMLAYQIVGLSEKGDVVKGGLFDKILTSATALIDIIEKNKESVVAFGRSIIDAVSFVAQRAIPTMDQFRVALASIQGWIGYVRGEFAKLEPYTMFLVAQLGILWETIASKLVPSLQNLWTQLSPILIPAIKAIATVVGATLGAAFSVAIAILDTLIKSFSNWINSISSAVEMIKKLISWIGKIKVPDWLGGGSIGGNIKSMLSGLPFFADGIKNFQGGLAVVGERGPELVNLPRGSDVIPNHEIAPVGRQGATITNYITMDRFTDIDALNRRMSFQAAVL
jgi:tape measure domain-containing protein